MASIMVVTGRQPQHAWRLVALSLVSYALALSASAQRDGSHGPLTAPPYPSQSPQPGTINASSAPQASDPANLRLPSIPDPGTRMNQSESCTNWTESGLHSPTVSATRLAVPGKASSEYQKACGAFKDKKWKEAEDHVRKAIAAYPEYAAAWVLLGQVLDGENKAADAQSACTQAMKVDAAYVPPYLCLAAFAAKQGDWNQVSVLSDRAMALDPVSNPFAFYFAALSEFHFEQLRQAEANALAALRLDSWHRLPELHYMLAQIYKARGDLPDAATNLREYLKQASADSQDTAAAKSLLAQIDPTPEK